MKRKNISTLAALALVLSLLIPLALAADMPIQHTHQWQEVSRTESTCATNGRVTYRCRCGETKVESLPTKGHNYSPWELTAPPTCEEPGVKTHKCSACGRTETRAVVALGHDWDEGVITKLPIAMGGTSILIVVSVALETARTLESQMMMRHHSGFLK